MFTVLTIWCGLGVMVTVRLLQVASCPGSYCGPALGCGHWLALEGQAGLVDPSLLGVLVGHGGLRGGRTETSLW